MRRNCEALLKTKIRSLVIWWLNSVVICLYVCEEFLVFSLCSGIVQCQMREGSLPAGLHEFHAWVHENRGWTEFLVWSDLYVKYWNFQGGVARCFTATCHQGEIKMFQSLFWGTVKSAVCGYFSDIYSLQWFHYSVSRVCAGGLFNINLCGRGSALDRLLRSQRAVSAVSQGRREGGMEKEKSTTSTADASSFHSCILQPCSLFVFYLSNFTRLLLPLRWRANWRLSAVLFSGEK